MSGIQAFQFDLYWRMLPSSTFTERFWMSMSWRAWSSVRHAFGPSLTTGRRRMRFGARPGRGATIVTLVASLCLAGDATVPVGDAAVAVDPDRVAVATGCWLLLSRHAAASFRVAAAAAE